MALGREEFSNAKSVQEPKNALFLAIGEEDLQVLAVQSKKVFGEMGRRIELNEKFDCFINKLVKKAEAITTTNYKIDVVVE